MRREHGVDLARITLGHANVLATQIYVLKEDRQLAHSDKEALRDQLAMNTLIHDV